MKFEIELGGGKLTFEGETLQEIIRESVFYNQLPTHCPIDGTVAVFAHNRDSDDNDYYGLVSTGTTAYEYKFGVRKTDHKLFPKFWPHDVWVMYDAERKANVAVWLNGQTLTKPYPTITMNKRTVLFNGSEVQAPIGRKSLNDDEPQGSHSPKEPLPPTDFANSDEAANWAVKSRYYPDFTSAKNDLVSVYKNLSSNQKTDKSDKSAFWLAWTKHCQEVRNGK